MTVVDFIDVIDDIIDLSSDEETVQEEHIATQPRATLLDRQAVFVLADEGRQDAQAAFVSVGEGSQEATESGHTVKATAASSVAQKEPLDTAATQNCPPTIARAFLPTAVSFPSPTSTTPNAMTFEGNDGKLLRVKVRRPRKNYHTETPKRSPRLREKQKGNNKSAVQLAVVRKRSRMLEPAEEPAASTSNAESSKTLSTSPANIDCSLNMIAHETDLMLLV